MEKQIVTQHTAIYCNENRWSLLRAGVEKLNPTKIFILVDTNTFKYSLELFLKHAVIKTPIETIIMPSGEKNKTIHTCIDIWNTLTKKGADRSSLLINLGGGVVTDVGGFVASTFKRGIEFINVPTSLLAMVDAAIGGKNGVDLGTLKNQVGVVNNPSMVVVDPVFLNTLPKQAFVRFPNLIFLSLEFNQLETLEQDMFQGLDHLRVLWLTGNHIQPEEDMYANGILLQNHIENIHEETFIPLGKSLQVLLMHHNYLTSLPADTMFGPENMPQLRVLKLLDNPWKDEMKETFDKLHNSWDAAAAAAKGRVVCKKHKSSRGECLQLDVTEDSGDDLEDIWEEMHMALADGDVLIEAMNDLPPHDENFDYQDYRYQDREEEDRESEL